jgi:hypothetical protein
MVQITGYGGGSRPQRRRPRAIRDLASRVVSVFAESECFDRARVVHILSSLSLVACWKSVVPRIVLRFLVLACVMNAYP